jgi:hypothetical protein
MNKPVLALLMVLVSSVAFAIDREPTYDYTGFGTDLIRLDGLTESTTAPHYNTSTGYMDNGAFTFDGSNDWLKRNSTTFPACNYTASTPLLIAVKADQPTEPTGAEVMVKYCFDFTSNTGRMFALTSGNRLLGQDGSDFDVGSNASANITLGAPQMYYYWFNGTQLVMLNNLVSVYNQSETGILPNTTQSSDPFAIGAENSGAGRYGGSIYSVQIYQGIKTWSDIVSIHSANGSLPTSYSGLVAYHSFENTTSTNLSVSLSTSYREYPENFIGFHTGNTPLGNETWVDTDGDGTNEAASNVTESRTVFENSGADRLRFDSDFSNICPTRNSSNGACNYAFTTGSNQNYKNLRIHQSLVREAYDISGIAQISIDDVPPWLASNASDCNYGLSASDQEDCDPTSYSNVSGYGAVVGQYLIDVGCVSYGTTVCGVDGDNEPYLPQFYKPNSTAVSSSGACTTRVSQINAHYNNTFYYTKLYLQNKGYNPALIDWGSPAFTNGSSSCGWAALQSFSTTFPKGGANSPDYINSHPYDSNAVCGLTTELSNHETYLSSVGWNGSYGYTESECNNNANSNSSDQGLKTAQLGESLVYLIQNTTTQYWIPYKFASITTSASESENYFAYRPSAIAGSLLYRASYYVVNASQNFSDGGLVYPCTSTDSDVKCAYVRKNSTMAHLFVVNKQNNQLDIDKISLSSLNITSARKVSNLESQAITGNYTDPSYLPYYGIEMFELTTTSQSLDNTAPNITINATYISNSTFQINFTANESANASIQYGNTTSLGSTVGVSSYITGHSINLTGLSSGETYYYNFTLCDSTGNCGYYGGYSFVTAPSVLSSILPSTAYANDTLLGYCSATSADVSVYYSHTWYKNGAVYEDSPLIILQNTTNRVSTYNQVSGLSDGTTVCHRSDSSYTGSIDNFSVEFYSEGCEPNNNFYCSARVLFYSGNSTQPLNNLYTGSTVDIRDYSYGAITQDVVTDIDLSAEYAWYCIESMGTNEFNTRFLSGVDSTYQSSTDGGTTWSSNNQYWINGTIRGYNKDSYSQGSTLVSSVTPTDAKGDNYTLTCSAYNGLYSGYVNSSSLMISNSLPVASDAIIIDQSSYVNCTYDYSDVDSDAESGSTYRWFKNTSLISGATSRTLSSGNYSNGDRLVCEVRPRDGTAYGSYLNSSTFNVNDTSAPVLSNFVYSQTTTPSDIAHFSVICTDNYGLANNYPRVSWRTPSSTWEGNYTMVHVGNDEYTYDHVFGVAGTYNQVSVFCYDGNGNTDSIVSSSPILVTASGSGSGSGGGGGGGGGSAKLIGVEVLSAQAINQYCAANQTQSPIKVLLKNPYGNDATYLVSVKNQTCETTSQKVSISALSTKEVQFNNCQCPTTEASRGSITVQDSRDNYGEVVANVPFSLTPNPFAALLSKKLLIPLSIAVLALAAALIGMGALSRGR